MTATDSVPIAPIPSRVQAFAAWWLSELKAMIPAGGRSWFVGDTTLTDVQVDSVGLRLLPADGKAAGAVAISMADARSSPVLRELKASGRERVRLLLTAEQLLVKKLQLPMAIEENLREAIGFEMDRYTPFKADQAYYDVRVLARDANKETIEVQLGVAPRAIVDPLLGTLRSFDLSVGAIGAAKGVTADGNIDLLPAADRPAQKWGRHLKLNAGLLVLALAMALVAVLLPIWQKREKVLELIPQVAKASAEFTGSQRVYDEYSRLANQYNVATGKKHGQQPVLVILEELARISPDTTYLQSLELKSTGKIRELTMVGEAQSASKVLEVLEQSSMFQNASQRSQTTRGSQPNTERYHVSTEVKAKPLPAMAVALVGAAETGPPVAVVPPPVVDGPAKPAATPGPAATPAAVVSPAAGTPPGGASAAPPGTTAPVAPATAPVKPATAPESSPRKAP